MSRAEKVEKVREITERLTSSQAAVFANFRGLTVHDATELRTALADSEAAFTVVKNTLTRLAVRDAGLAELEGFLDGPTAIAFIRGDLVAGTKSLLDAAKRFPVLEVKGGVAEGRVLSADDIRALGALPSREEMLAKVAGLGKVKMAMAVGALQGLMTKLLRLLEAYKDKAPPGDLAAAE
ncbi:MAG: 50S ribosomal protein L10, partial [Actinomycetota bacterium]|nr:50S ribosomal protein L10 [Actinomycetota bacterium]